MALNKNKFLILKKNQIEQTRNNIKRDISYLGEETARTLAHWGIFKMVQQIFLSHNCYTFVYMYIIALYSNTFVVDKKKLKKKLQLSFQHLP